MNGVSSKVAAGGATGAVVGIIVWVAGLLGLTIPPEIAVYFGTILSFGVAWFVKETATKHPELSAVVEQYVDDSTEKSDPTL